jgi:hypothetical protein
MLGKKLCTFCAKDSVNTGAIMCDLILILSRCGKIVNSDYQFHFKGFYQGLKIVNLVAITKHEEKFDVDQDYLLWGRKVDVNNGVLRVEIIKFKKII